jgi:hypothetical protein
MKKTVFRLHRKRKTLYRFFSCDMMISTGTFPKNNTIMIKE